jgi:HTH-type transcriptional regulator / antitoxin HipB
MSDPIPNFAALLLAERKRQGLSREQLAGLADVSTSFIRDAESRPEVCSVGHMARLAAALGWVLRLDTTAATFVNARELRAAPVHEK